MKLVFCFLVLLMFATLLAPVFGDGVVPRPKYLDVQGAKIVSEGAYFYFNITSRYSNPSPSYILQVRVCYNYRFKWLDYEEYFWLETNESRIFHLIAPYIDSCYEEFGITINYAVGGLATDKPIYTVVFYVLVVDEATTKSLLAEVKGKRFWEVWNDYATTYNENTMLKQKIRELENTQSNDTYSVSEVALIFGLGGFIVGALSVIVFRYKRFVGEGKMNNT